MARFKHLTEWLAWLETLHPCEIDLGLKRVFSVACRLGIVQQNSRTTFSGRAINHNGSQPHVVTIAGTNGKGSCVKTLESVILAQHRSHCASHSHLSDSVFVSAFTSPHILHYNERIKLNGLPLCDTDICALFTSIDQARGDTSLTYFEFAALAALLAMHRSNSPIWVLEVGLGGRLDAVNLVDCSVAVITSIGLDHQMWLGNTVEQIAKEKGGIMRTNTPVVFASQDMPKVLNDIAHSLNAKPYQQGADYVIQSNECGHHCITTEQSRFAFSQFGLPLESIAAAIMVCHILRLSLDIINTQQALNHLSLEGRFEIIRHNNAVFILDVAHNVMATQRLAENVLAYQRNMNDVGEITAICGMMADKDSVNSLKSLTDVVSKWVCCDIPNNSRAESASILSQHLIEANVNSVNITVQDSVTKAIELIIDQQYHNKHDPALVSINLIFGSFFTVSAAKMALQGKK